MSTKCTPAFETKEKTLPGKWQIYNDGADIFIISGGNVREADTIATISRGYKHRAKLIVSAPELLEACKVSLRVVKNLANSENTEIYKILEQAITKSEA